MTQTIKARPTTYKGVQMRSRLEAGYAMWLDSMQIEWEYEPRAFANERGQYLPDFKVQVLDCGRGEFVNGYIEVKPFHPDQPADDWPENTPKLNALAERMSVVLDSDPSAFLAVTWPGLSCDFEYGSTPILLNAGVLSDGRPYAAPVAILWSRGFLSVGFSAMHHPWPGRWWEVQ